jgi:hypothetical protein
MQGLHALAAVIHPELFGTPKGLRRIDSVKSTSALTEQT